MRKFKWKVIPHRKLHLEGGGKIPATVGNSTLPKNSWLSKGFNKGTQDPQQRYFDKKALQCKGCYRKCLRNAGKKVVHPL